MLRKEVCPSVRLSGRPGPKWGRKRDTARVKIPACCGARSMYKVAGRRQGWGRGGPAATAPTRGPPAPRALLVESVQNRYYLNVPST